MLAVEWPTSKAVLDAGFTDVYDMLFPDPVTDTGFTWTPKPGDNEVHDRIDYTYYNSERITINSVNLVGPDDGVSDITIDPYPSDHRAVVSEMELSIQE